jgi:hypothetical protein
MTLQLECCVVYNSKVCENALFSQTKKWRRLFGTDCTYTPAVAIWVIREWLLAAVYKCCL